MIPDVPYRFTIRALPKDEGGGYLIEFPDLPGCMSDGATIEDAITNGIDARRGWIEAMRAEGHSDPRTDPLRGGMRRSPGVPLPNSARCLATPYAWHKVQVFAPQFGVSTLE